MNPDKVVVHVVDGESRDVVLDFLRKRIRQPGESGHLHPHGEILALDVAGGDMLPLRIANLRLFLAADTVSGGVADLGGFAGTTAIDFPQDGIIYVTPKCLAFLALLLLAVGILLQTTKPASVDDAFFAWLGYVPWDLVQQYLLNSYFLNRFEAVASRRTALTLSAALFAHHHKGEISPDQGNRVAR